MDTIKDIVAQEQIELHFGRKHVYQKIREYVVNQEDLQQKIKEGIYLVEGYMSKEYYLSKNARIEHLKTMNIPHIVHTLVEMVCTILRPELFTSVSAQLAARLGFDDKADSLKTAGELLAVICNTNLYDIYKPNKYASLEFVPRIILPQYLIDSINNMEYLPPMVCEPVEITGNYQNGYLTFKDSMVLGKGNHHDGDLCLDVINTMNKVSLKLDTAFLSTVEEEPTFALDTQEKIDQWANFKAQSYRMYMLMERHGNKFHLTHKVDKRGRIYAQGYHISTQGTAFKKAAIELSKEEYITGN